MGQSPSGESGADARSLLANERTVLAWVRTALTLLALGVAVFQFGTALDARRALAAVLVGLGGVTAVIGAVRFGRADRDIRQGRLPTTARSVWLLAAAVAALSAAILIALVVAVDGQGGR